MFNIKLQTSEPGRVGTLNQCTVTVGPASTMRERYGSITIIYIYRLNYFIDITKCTQYYCATETGEIIYQFEIKMCLTRPYTLCFTKHDNV